jgi:hypothetical protein
MYLAGKQFTDLLLVIDEYVNYENQRYERETNLYKCFIGDVPN